MGEEGKQKGEREGEGENKGEEKKIERKGLVGRGREIEKLEYEIV